MLTTHHAHYQVMLEMAEERWAGRVGPLGISSQAVLVRGLGKLMRTNLRPVATSAAVTMLHSLALRRVD